MHGLANTFQRGDNRLALVLAKKHEVAGVIGQPRDGITGGEMRSGPVQTVTELRRRQIPADTEPVPAICIGLPGNFARSDFLRDRGSLNDGPGAGGGRAQRDSARAIP